MKKRTLIVGLALAAIVAVVVIYGMFNASSVAARPVRLVITGSEGQRFTGSYVADGVTNTLSALAPATISILAKEVTYEFQREGGQGEFRVALFVGEHCRTTTTSGHRQAVRGWLRYFADGESYGAF